jgi:hypothetical protein
MPAEIQEPWRSFLGELDAALSGEVHLHCLGGFVLTARYGLPRPTADVDVLFVFPSEKQADLARSAGCGSGLHSKYGVYLDIVTIVNPPCRYDERLTEMFPGAFRHLRLFALDPYDLALAKLERNSPRDRDDVVYLADTVALDLAVLRERYENEMRPYLASPSREGLTLQLWSEMIEERRRGSVT